MCACAATPKVGGTLSRLQATAQRQREERDENDLFNRVLLRQMPTCLVLEEVVVTDARIRKARNERRLVAHRATVGGIVFQLLPALEWRGTRFIAALHHINACPLGVSLRVWPGFLAEASVADTHSSCLLGHTLTGVGAPECLRGAA